MFLSLFALYLNYSFWFAKIRLSDKAGVLFCVLGFITMVFPLVSKYFRKISGLSGKILEIIAFAIGCYNFYFFVFVYTSVSLYIPIFLVALCIFIYSVTFNKIKVTEYSKFECSELVKNIRKMNFATSIIVVFGILNIFVFLNIEKASLCFDLSLLSLLFYLIVELISILTFCICSNKIIMVVFIVEIIVNVFVTFLNISLVVAACDYYYDDAVENLCYSIISLTIYSIVFCVLLCYVFKVCKKSRYNSLRYREKRYKKVAKIHQYYTSGVITLEEFEKTKKEILKNIDN